MPSPRAALRPAPLVAPTCPRAIANQQLVQVARICGHADALVVDPELFVRFQIVPHEHFLFAADQRCPDFHGREPVHVYMGNDSLWEVHRDEGNVFDAIQVLLPSSHDGLGFSPIT